MRAIIALEPAGPPFVSRGVNGLVRKSYGITDIPLTYDPPLPSPLPEGEGGGEEAGDDSSAPLRMQTIASPSGEVEPWILQAEPARRLVNLLNTTVIVVTGGASYHAAYDECMVRFLRQAGVVDVEWLRLAEHGIEGNGHLMFLELNNLEIARLVEERMARVV